MARRWSRTTRATLHELHPRLLPALLAHPGIAFVLVRSASGGPVAYPDGGVVGPDSMHQVLRGWLAHVGQDAYAGDASGADAR